MAKVVGWTYQVSRCGQELVLMRSLGDGLCDA
jgi:hypothetical protein